MHFIHCPPRTCRKTIRTNKSFIREKIQNEFAKLIIYLRFQCDGLNYVNCQHIFFSSPLLHSVCPCWPSDTGKGWDAAGLIMAPHSQCTVVHLGDEHVIQAGLIRSTDRKEPSSRLLGWGMTGLSGPILPWQQHLILASSHA